MKKPGVLLLLLTFSLALALGAMVLKRGREGGPEVRTVRLVEGPRTLLYLPQYVALALGFFGQEGLEVLLSPATTEEAALLALEDGRAEVALVGLEQAVYACAQGPGGLKAFAAAAQADGHFLLARKAGAAFRWQDLKGKTVIAGWPDSRETVLLEGILRQNGVAPYREVTLYTNIPANLRLGAFTAGSGDFIVLAEPQASLAEERGLGRVVASLSRDAGRFPAAVYVAGDAFLAACPHTAQRFVNAVYRAQLWLAGHTAAEAAQVAAPYFKHLDGEVLARAVQRLADGQVWSPGPAVPPDGYRHFVGFLLQSREVRREVPPEELLDNRFASGAPEGLPPEGAAKKPRLPLTRGN